MKLQEVRNKIDDLNNEVSKLNEALKDTAEKIEFGNYFLRCYDRYKGLNIHKKIALKTCAKRKENSIYENVIKLAFMY